nr:glutathione S-transferase [uncultured Albidiferax sp.]
MHTTTNRRPAQPIQLYRHVVSGHAHRVQLMLSLLDLPFDTVEVDLLAKAQKSPEFLALNAFGQVPVIQDGDVTLADSNAILVYLATRYAAPGTWLPSDALGAAQVQRWLSVAAGQIAFGPAAARIIQLFKLPSDPSEAIHRANQLFAVMDAHLQPSGYLVGSTPTIADIACYSYIAHAPEGNVSLQPYPQLRAWLARIEALPGFVPMVQTRICLAA